MVAVAVAAAISRLFGATHPADSASTDRYIPEHLDPARFALASGKWLIVVFSSATCETCRTVVDDIAAMAKADLLTIAVQFEQDPNLHRHYRIDAVPTTLIADPTGTVRKSFLGPVGRKALEIALAEATQAYESGNV